MGARIESLNCESFQRNLLTCSLEIGKGTAGDTQSPHGEATQTLSENTLRAQVVRDKPTYV